MDPHDRTWYRKTPRIRTKEQLEAELQAKLDRGEISVEEAEDEWQNFTNPEPRFCGTEW